MANTIRSGASPRVSRVQMTSQHISAGPRAPLSRGALSGVLLLLAACTPAVGTLLDTSDPAVASARTPVGRSGDRKAAVTPREVMSAAVGHGPSGAVLTANSAPVGPPFGFAAGIGPAVVGEHRRLVAGTASAVDPGAWVNVTPRNVDLANALSCGNFGVETVQVDPATPSTLYALFHCQGIWKSVDFGATWTGPINKGSAVSDCAGGLRIAANPVAATPTLYVSCIRGEAMGFWRSLDGGAKWRRFTVGPAAGDRQDVYPPSVDPYDAKHLIMAGHEQDLIVESVDGGERWTKVAVHAGMRSGHGTGAISFVNTGDAVSTRRTWLWMAQQSGGVYGTWRTTDGGAAWVQVDKNEHPHGLAEVFQPGATGVLYMAGAYSQHGWGVLRSADFGVSWAHVGSTGNQRVVFGTPRRMYSSYSYPVGLGASYSPAFQTAPQPGTAGWTSPATPAAMREGAAQAAVTSDGTRFFVVTANYGAGLWRYIEP